MTGVSVIQQFADQHGLEMAGMSVVHEDNLYPDRESAARHYTKN